MPISPLFPQQCKNTISSIDKALEAGSFKSLAFLTYAHSLFLLFFFSIHSSAYPKLDTPLLSQHHGEILAINCNSCLTLRTFCQKCDKWCNSVPCFRSVYIALCNRCTHRVIPLWSVKPLCHVFFDLFPYSPFSFLTFKLPIKLC